MTNIHKVRDLMDKQFTTFRPDTPITEAIDTLIKKSLLGVIVVDDDGNLLGILSEKDCLKVMLQDTYYGTPGGTVGDYYHKVTDVIDSEASLITVAEIFLKNPFRRLPVVDNGKLVGQITRRDLLKGFRQFDYNFKY